MAAAPGAGDVAEAMAMTFEREDPGGAPWCPPQDATVLRRWITDRSRELGGGIRRVVRLARLASLADGRDYLRFLYVRVPALRTSHFKAALQRAVAEGHLSRGIAEVTASGIRLKEAAVQSAGEDFEIDYVQMPRLAALLDVLHNSLGYADVAELLQPILVPGLPGKHADEVARAMQAKFNAWLSERLGSLEHIRQAKTIRAFLASQNALAPDAVDDETILSFWTEHAALQDDDVAGFRLYRSAARAVLRYRKALRDAAMEVQIREALPFGEGGENASVDLERIEAAELNTDAWRSPLLLLAAPPADAVKWLNRKERLQLLNYLGGPHPDQDPAEAPLEVEDALADPDTGLSGEERFDLRFVRTLLRADVFGAAQSSIVARLRKRAPAPVAVGEVMAPIGEAAYGDCAAAYDSLRDQLQLQSLAALAALVETGAAEALILLKHFGGEEAVDAVLALARASAASAHAEQHASAPKHLRLVDDDREPADGLLEQVSTVVSAAAANPDVLASEGARDLIARARAAARKVNRLGFRREDRADPGMLLALRTATVAVPDLLAELDRLAAALSMAGLRDHASADRARFAAAFEQIYCRQ